MPKPGEPQLSLGFPGQEVERSGDISAGPAGGEDPQKQVSPAYIRDRIKDRSNFDGRLTVFNCKVHTSRTER